MSNENNLRTPTTDEAKEMQKKSAEKRKENNAKKKLMSQIYAEFLEKKYQLKKEGDIKEITGDELVQESMKKIIARGDSSSVSLMREIREGTEGTKLKLDGAVAVNNDMDTTEERLKKFKELIGNG